MFIQKWQIDELVKDATNPLIGRACSYQFETTPSPEETKPGICGLSGYIIAVSGGSTEKLPTFNIAFETPVPDFFVTQENLQAYIAPVQYEETGLSLVEAANFKEIVKTIYGLDL